MNKNSCLFNLRTETVAKLLYKNIICRFKCFKLIVMNKDFEKKIIIKELLNRYRIRIKLTSTYYALINEMIEEKY